MNDEVRICKYCGYEIEEEEAPGRWGLTYPQHNKLGGVGKSIMFFGCKKGYGVHEPQDKEDLFDILYKRMTTSSEELPPSQQS